MNHPLVMLLYAQAVGGLSIDALSYSPALFSLLMFYMPLLHTINFCLHSSRVCVFVLVWLFSLFFLFPLTHHLVAADGC